MPLPLLTLIPLAMKLAEFAPGIVKLVTGNDKAGEVASHVLDIAKVVTGAPTAEQAVDIIKADPAKAMDFQLAMADRQQALENMYLMDTQNARARDVELAKAGQVNHRANALAAGAGALVVFCLFIVVWQSEMDDFAKATITLILGRSLGWIEQIFSFEFGTTRANKTKDDTINNLTK
jgi:hypothetical protein